MVLKFKSSANVKLLIATGLKETYGTLILSTFRTLTNCKEILLNVFYKKVLKIYNYGNYYRDFTYVNDVVKILFLSVTVKTKGKIFNLSGSRPVKLISFIKKIKNILKKDIKIKYMPRRKAEVLKTHGSNEKLISFFKFKKFSSLDRGLKETIKWFDAYKNKKELVV